MWTELATKTLRKGNSGHSHGLAKPPLECSTACRRDRNKRDLLIADFDWGLVELRGDATVLHRARQALGVLVVDRVQQVPDARCGSVSKISSVSLLEDSRNEYAQRRWPERWAANSSAQPDPARAILFRPGLFAAVQLCLASVGIEVVNARGCSIARIFSPLVAKTCQDTDLPFDFPIRDFISRPDCGVIRVQSRWQIVECVAAAATAFVGARIAVLARTDSDADRIAEDLPSRLQRRSLVEPVDYVASRRSPSELSRLHVARFDNGGNLPQEAVDLLFVSDARLLLEVRPSDLISAGHHRARMFGFLQNHQRLSRSEELELSRFFGFETIAALPSGHVHRPFDIVAQRTRTQATRSRGTSATAHVRSEIIGAQSRNNVISTIARFLVAPTATKLPRRIAPAIGAAKAILHGRRVMLIVEHIEHAVALAALLPSASLRLSLTGREYLQGTGQMPHVRRMTGLERAICVVTTRDALGPKLENLRPDCFDAYLLAGGWKTFPSEFERFARAEPSRSQRPLLVVTFFDDRVHRTETRAVAALLKETRWWSPDGRQTRIALDNLRSIQRKGRR